MNSGNFKGDTSKPARAEEALRVVAEYAEDLREMIKKLKQAELKRRTTGVAPALADRNGPAAGASLKKSKKPQR